MQLKQRDSHLKNTSVCPNLIQHGGALRLRTSQCRRKALYGIALKVHKYYYNFSIKMCFQAFLLFDLNGDGYIDHSDLQATLVSLGENVDENAVKNMLAEVCINKLALLGHNFSKYLFQF